LMAQVDERAVRGEQYTRATHTHTHTHHHTHTTQAPPIHQRIEPHNHNEWTMVPEQKRGRGRDRGSREGEERKAEAGVAE